MMPPIGHVDPTLQSHVPSWISSKERLPFGTVSRLAIDRLNADLLVGSYNAHHSTSPRVRLGRDRVTNTCTGSLYCKGIPLGQITRRSVRMVDGIFTKECLNILRAEPTHKDLAPVDSTDTMWKALCANRNGQGEPAPLAYRSAMIRLLQLNLDALSAHRDLESVRLVTHIDPDDLLEMELPKDVESLLQAIRAMAWNRRTFMAKSSSDSRSTMVGLMPKDAHVDDYLCVLYGCSVPVVLRKHLFGDKHCWELIGEAYVEGLMDGEGISLLPLPTLVATELEFEIR
jgi:hypothetical protein